MSSKKRTKPAAASMISQFLSPCWSSTKWKTEANWLTDMFLGYSANMVESSRVSQWFVSPTMHPSPSNRRGRDAFQIWNGHHGWCLVSIGCPITQRPVITLHVQHKPSFQGFPCCRNYHTQWNSFRGKQWLGGAWSGSPPPGCGISMQSGIPMRRSLGGWRSSFVGGTNICRKKTEGGGLACFHNACHAGNCYS